VRHFLNVVSGGIFLGLSLLAISVLTALYATPWQAATILAVLVGIFASVSLYFGGCAKCQAREYHEHHEQPASEKAQNHQAHQASPNRTIVNLDLNLLIVHLVLIIEEPEEEPPLFI
jgi:hypothetical protein